MFRYPRLSLALTTVAGLGLFNIAGCPSNTDVDGNNDNNNDGNGSAINAFLPSSISLDTSELDETTDSALLNPQGYGGLLGGARDVVNIFQSAADAVLEIGHTVSDDLSNPDDSTVAGTFNVNGASVDYKCDFAPFDFDGDGQLDGSGDSQTAPVAFRIWTDKGDGYVQFMCGVITDLPANGNVGAGTLVARPFNVDSNADENMQVRIEWDRTNTDHSWNFGYISGTVDPVNNVVLDIGSARVDIRSSDGFTFEKTVRGSGDMQQHPQGYDTSVFAVHYPDGGGSVLLSAESTGGTDPVSEENVCLNPAGLSLDSSGGCDDYDTQDMNFLDVPIGGENEFPAEFENAPTF